MTLDIKLGGFNMLNPNSHHDPGYEEYLKSTEWKRLRKDKIEQSNGICEACKNPLGRTVPHLHHETYDHFGYEEPEDTKIMHKKCHTFRHHGNVVEEND